MNLIPLLATPLACTTTLPVVAPVGTFVAIDVAVQLVIVVATVPLNVTVPLPCVEPKFVPEIVTAVPTLPDVTDSFVIFGAGTTVKLRPLLATPLTVTTTLPMVAPLGTVTFIDPAAQLATLVTLVPLNVTVLLPCEDPKFVPVIVTGAPTAPDVIDRLVMLGVGTTVKLTPLLATPLACTTTLPVVAPVGTFVAIDVALQLVIVAVVPLNVTVPLPCVEPKFVPVIVTDVPTGPDVTDSFVIFGAGTTVKLTPLLATPPTVTTTLPVVAPLGTLAVIEPAAQLATLVADVPLKVTVLVPCGEPNPDPDIVTEAPTAPEDTESPVMFGGAVTVKVDPLLATPLTVTTTGPDVAPLGTCIPIAPAPQPVPVCVVAGVPLNVTVLVLAVGPKLLPLIVIHAPITPCGGFNPVIVGAAVKPTALLGLPFTHTTMLPVVAFAGTGATIELALQLLGVAGARLNITLLLLP